MNCRKISITSSLVAMLFGAFAVTGALAQPSNQNQNQGKNKGGGGLGGGATLQFNFNLGNQEKTQTKKPVKRKSTKTTKKKKKKTKKTNTEEIVTEQVTDHANNDGMCFYFKKRSRMIRLLKRMRQYEKVRTRIDSLDYALNHSASTIPEKYYETARLKMGYILMMYKIWRLDVVRKRGLKKPEEQRNVAYRNNLWDLLPTEHRRLLPNPSDRRVPIN